MPASPKRSGRCIEQTNDKTWADRAMASTRDGGRARAGSSERALHRRADGVSQWRLRRGANSELERALELQPTYEDAIRLHGTVLMRQGEIDAGLAEFQKRDGAASERRGGLQPTWASRCLRASRFQEALDAFDKAIALSPGSAISLSRAGAAAQQLGDTKRALDVLRTGQRDPAARRNVLEHRHDSIRPRRLREGGRRLRRLAADSAA